ncbi:CTR copper uptake transporter [Lentinula aff. detonsa]|uniref:Copper transport protein n=1 Tax=Lentinula aff. detonsa TaxID=2804958 RepID=A0AA38L428_9AGAR|nr:CTR copper uptake transporter [Lentinula aff. detonsa]KAJ3795543.1 CTR copper uptake transporter [Lentinula aff. detonsa]
MQARDSNGMIMSMDGSMDLASGNMLTYLHFTVGGDILWFQGWVPQGPGAMFGACVGLFLLALVDRWIAACRAMMEVHWAKRAQIAYANKLNANENADKKRAVSPLTPGNVFLMRRAPPFIPAHDIVRGILHAGQAALTFAFMLVVMTFQLGFIIAIVVGLGVGETLFGRYAHAGTTLH